MRWLVRLVLIAVVVGALILVSSGAAIYAILVIAFGLIVAAFDRLIPSTGSLGVDADHAFDRARHRARLSRRRNADDDRLALLFPTAEARASKRVVGIRAIGLNSIIGTVEPDRAKGFDGKFRPPPWSRGRWKLMWIAARRGASFPPISVYRLCGAHYVRDGHHRVSVARALGATEIDAEVTELRPPSEGRDANGPTPITGA
jgi:hypothetical protein